MTGGTEETPHGQQADINAYYNAVDDVKPINVKLEEMGYGYPRVSVRSSKCGKRFEYVYTVPTSEGPKEMDQIHLSYVIPAIVNFHKKFGTSKTV